MMALEKTVYVGPFVHCKTLTELDICTNGMIGVDESGKIAFVSRSQGKDLRSHGKEWEDAKIVSIPDHGFFFPGFIDTHIHASQYPNAGVFGNSTLLDWLNTYTFPLESSFSDLETANRIYNRVVSRTLSHGTTTACYYATIHVPATNLLADTCQKRGQRAFVGRVCMDRMSPDYYQDESTETSIRDSQACIDHVKTIDPRFKLITPIITPRFAPSCTEATLTALGKLHHDTGVPCQTHISENKDEIKLVRELFPDHDSYTDVYDKTGLLTSKTILAHAVHLTSEERALIKTRAAKISHCPASNTALTSGAAPVRELLDAGLTVGLGTDMSGGYTPSMLAQCREAVFVSRHAALANQTQKTTDSDPRLSVPEVLYLATRGGAAVTNLEHRIGGFEVGKEWDAQMVSLPQVSRTDFDVVEDAGPVEIFGNEQWEEKIAKWVYTGDDRNAAAVWVQGRLVSCRKGFQV
nr:putative guanine deaminase [Quercus suber]